MLALAVQTNFRSIEYVNETGGFSDEAQILGNQYAQVITQFTDAISTANLKRKFNNLSATWKYDMQYSSSTNELLHDPAYIEIIKMDKKALPFIFEDLKLEPNHWFTALTFITDANPIPKELAGDVKAMTNVWLDWGKKHDYTA